jgi:hypothetical protein
MFKILVLLAGLGLTAACSALPLPSLPSLPSQQAPLPTPIIIVVTATPNGTRTPAVEAATPTSPGSTVATRTLEATSEGEENTAEPVDTPTGDVKPTDVKYVLAKQDINIRSGPGTDFDIVGGVYAGQTAQVLGFKSADDQWWRVVCPVDGVKDCWVSADPTLTEPAEAPAAAPTESAEVRLENFTRQLANTFRAKNYDGLWLLMGDPFNIGYWRSEGVQVSRAQALAQLKGWMDPAKEIVVDLANKTNQTALLDGTPPLQMWNPADKPVKSVYVEGLGADQKGQALLVIAQRNDESFYWYAMLFAAGGFV